MEKKYMPSYPDSELDWNAWRDEEEKIEKWEEEKNGKYE